MLFHALQRQTDNIKDSQIFWGTKFFYPSSSRKPLSRSARFALVGGVGEGTPPTDQLEFFHLSPSPLRGCTPSPHVLILKSSQTAYAIVISESLSSCPSLFSSLYQSLMVTISITSINIGCNAVFLPFKGKQSTYVTVPGRYNCTRPSRSGVELKLLN